MCRTLFSSFNPRARVGRDWIRLYTELLNDPVSIHAPAWGATLRLGGKEEVGDVSIHAPAWGATQRLSIALSYRYVSIHAPAWGATRFDARHTPRQARFNPRARVGRDAALCSAALLCASFNPRARVGRDAV